MCLTVRILHNEICYWVNTWGTMHHKVWVAAFYHANTLFMVGIWLWFTHIFSGTQLGHKKSLGVYKNHYSDGTVFKYILFMKYTAQMNQFTRMTTEMCYVKLPWFFHSLLCDPHLGYNSSTWWHWRSRCPSSQYRTRPPPGCDTSPCFVTCKAFSQINESH